VRCSVSQCVLQCLLQWEKHGRERALGRIRRQCVAVCVAYESGAVQCVALCVAARATRESRWEKRERERMLGGMRVQCIAVCLAERLQCSVLQCVVVGAAPDRARTGKDASAVCCSVLRSDMVQCVAVCVAVSDAVQRVAVCVAVCAAVYVAVCVAVGTTRRERTPRGLREPCTTFKMSNPATWLYLAGVGSETKVQLAGLPSKLSIYTTGNTVDLMPWMPPGTRVPLHVKLINPCVRSSRTPIRFPATNFGVVSQSPTNSSPSHMNPFE